MTRLASVEILGGAAHTAHFSIGSGTRLAMEDAIALVRSLSSHVDEPLAAYQAERQPVARKIVDAANTSANWYESFAAKTALPPVDFAFDYLTRSGRMDMERLRKIAPGFMARYEAEKAAEGGALAGHPDVHECAVMAHEMADRRMTLRAVVRLREGKAGGEEQSEALRAYIKSRLQPYKYPRIVEYVADLPKTGAGKIDRQALLRAKEETL